MTKLKIGITGGIGSGKTTICKVFELSGIPVFYADAAAKLVMQKDRLLISSIIETFGAQSYSVDGILNRNYLASKIFNDENELQKLNSLVHPAVFRAFDEWAEVQKAPYVLKEAALLFESNSYQDCDFNILVKAPLELRIQRVIERDKTTEAEVLARMKRQWTDEEKEKLADFILQNDEKQFLIPQILTLHTRFLKESQTNDYT